MDAIKDFVTFEVLVRALLVVITTAVLYARIRKENRMPPGPMGIPLLGYLPFKGKRPALTYFNLSKKYGPVISLRMANRTVVVLNDFDSIQEALVKNGNVFSGRPALASVVEAGAGVGIATRTYDGNFKKLRKFALTTLRSFGLGKKSMEEKINEEIRCFMDLLRSKNGQSFNEHTDFATSVSNVLCNITLGKRFPYEDKPFRKMVDLVNESFADKSLAFAITLINIFPVMRFIPPISTYYNRFCDGLSYKRGFIRESIKEHKEDFDPDQSRDFIDEYLKEVEKAGKNDACFNEDQLTYVLDDLFLAGTETTSSTLRWCVLLFAHRPDIQTKVSDEVQRVIGESQPTMKHRDEMPYTRAFLHEITRHRTLAQLALPHLTTSAIEFRGFHIPKDTVVFPNLWAVHHDPENFEKPDEFDPQRFIDEETGEFRPHKKVIPFSVGPRYCLGEQLAKMELFLFLTNIVQNFMIARDPEKPLPTFETGVIGDAEVPQAYEVKYVSR